MAQKHSDRGCPARCLASCKSEDGKIGHSEVHRSIAEPGKDNDLPKTKCLRSVSFLHERDRVGPELSFRKVTDAGCLHLTQCDDSASRENGNHPRRCDVGNASDCFVTTRRDDRDDDADDRHHDRKRRIAQTEHVARNVKRNPKWNSNSGCRNGHHRPSQKAK